eukprot:TRINITY_DN1088_c0_g1_i1.p2 TRINITY_DN1088_c0_g1~~TRINITY_DN1088_c0_g1_i1.p2  ORF type:complete len:322 (+),score=134.61 TRINITY_DN1088_c0_g1_i1:70-966(+)
MASGAGYFIAHEKYSARNAEAELQAEIRRQQMLQRELQRSQHTQQALEQQLARGQAEAEQQIAREKLRWFESDFAQKKVHVMLQGLHTFSTIFHSVHWTAALIAGFATQLFVREKTDQAATWLVYVYWTTCLCSVTLLVHSIFVSTMSVTDATTLAYQGTDGLEDVKRAFQGLMRRRWDVYWNFLAGFIVFNCCNVLTIWLKLDQLEGPGTHLSSRAIVYGAIMSGMYLLIPVARMFVSYSRVRKLFKRKPAPDGAAVDYRERGRTGLDIREEDVLPETFRREPPTPDAAAPPAPAPP